MPWDALPDNLNPNINPNAWKGSDSDTWLMRWTIKLVGWQAFGPRAKEWWAKWRPVPIDLLKFNDGTPWRYENIGDQYYTSRVQYFSRWHILVQWPFSVSFHVYWKKGTTSGPGMAMGISKMFFAYGPTHFDADQVYWVPSCFVGGDWK